MKVYKDKYKELKKEYDSKISALEIENNKVPPFSDSRSKSTFPILKTLQPRQKTRK